MEHSLIQPASKLSIWQSATQPFLVSSRSAPPHDTKNGCVADYPFGGYREKYTRERHARGDATAPRGFAARSLVSLGQIGELARRLSRISHSFFFLFYTSVYFLYIHILRFIYISIQSGATIIERFDTRQKVVKYLSVTYPGEEPQLNLSCCLVVLWSPVPGSEIVGPAQQNKTGRNWGEERCVFLSPFLFLAIFSPAFHLRVTPFI